MKTSNRNRLGPRSAAFHAEQPAASATGTAICGFSSPLLRRPQRASRASAHMR